MKVTYTLTKEESHYIREAINSGITNLCESVECPNIDDCENCPMVRLNTKWAEMRAEMCEKIKQLEG